MNDWKYHPSPSIDASMSETLRNFPREPTMLAYSVRSMAALILRGWMRIYHRMTVDGRENLPMSGSYILVCNHTSHLDTMSLLCSVPLRQIHRTFPAAAADYFFSSLPRSAFSAVLINALPFDREIRGAESLTVCSELLKNAGNVLIIFPEGTRTTTGDMARFRSGIGRLVVGTDLPVVPCHLSGGTKAWPKGKAFPRPRKLRLRVGEPQTFEHLEKNSNSVHKICSDLEESVAKLGGACE